MNAALLVLLICAAIDVAACAFLLGFVWAEHRRIRREAAATGEAVPSAAGQLGCLLGLCLLGLAFLYATASLFLR